MNKINFATFLLCFCLAITGCVSSNYDCQIQNEAFNVLPTYCYGNECFDIQKKTKLQIWNSKLPDGQYKVETKTVTIEGALEPKEEKAIVSFNVNGDIITMENGDFIAQYDQRKKEIINVIDKSGTLDQKQMNMLKKSVKDLLSSKISDHASSGDIINLIIKTKLFGENIVLKMDKLIHGTTTYQGKQYVLSENRGTGVVRANNQKSMVTFGGYSLTDGNTNIVVKSVMDTTIKNNQNSYIVRVIQTTRLLEKKNEPIKTNIENEFIKSNEVLTESDDDLIIYEPENESVGGIVGKYKIILTNSIFGFEAGEYDEGEITIVNIATKKEYFAFSKNGYYYLINIPSGNYVFLNHKMVNSNGAWVRHGNKNFKSTDDIPKELFFHVKAKELTLMDNIEVSVKWDTKSKKPKWIKPKATGKDINGLIRYFRNKDKNNKWIGLGFNIN